ncbi:MAG: FtsX-like permease family protein, partial [Myxococcota bacterium]
FDRGVPNPAALYSRAKIGSVRPLRFDGADLVAALAHDVSPGARREAVVGAAVAQALGLRVGDHIEPSHGLEDGALAHAHEEVWEIVGVLHQSGTSIDGVVLINLDSFHRIEEHTASAEAGLSSLLVFPRRGVHTAMLLGELRGRSDLQVAQVSAEVRGLLERVGRFDVLFVLAAALSVVLAILSIFTSMLLAIRARRLELGVLRALGMPRARLLGLVVAEGAAVAALGGALGLVAGHALLVATGSWIESLAGFRPDASSVGAAELGVVASVALAGALAALIPGLQAYRVDVATALRHAE